MSSLIKVVPTGTENWSALNTHIIEKDNRLSWKAKGLHTYLITRPPNWQIREADLIKRARDGRDAVRAALDELEEAGYIAREQTRRGGKFAYLTVTVYGLPVNGKTVNGKPGHIVTALNDNNCIEGKRLLRNSQEPSGSPRPVPIPKHTPTPIILDYSELHQDQEKSAAAKSQQVKVTPKCVPVIEKWRRVGVNHRDGTKTFADAVRNLKKLYRGEFFDDKAGYARHRRPYSPAEVIQALETFDRKRNDPDFLPKDKSFLRGLSLSDFLYCPYARNGNGLGASIFIQCLEEPLRMTGNRSPELTTLVRQRVLELGGKRWQEDEAASCAQHLLRYWRNNKDFLQDHGTFNEKHLVSRWVGWLASEFPNFGPGHILGSNMTTAFERHLREMMR